MVDGMATQFCMRMVTQSGAYHICVLIGAFMPLAIVLRMDERSRRDKLDQVIIHIAFQNLGPPSYDGLALIVRNRGRQTTIGGGMSSY